MMSLNIIRDILNEPDQNELIHSNVNLIESKAKLLELDQGFTKDFLETTRKRLESKTCLQFNIDFDHTAFEMLVRILDLRRLVFDQKPWNPTETLENKRSICFKNMTE